MSRAARVLGLCTALVGRRAAAAPQIQSAGLTGVLGLAASSSSVPSAASAAIRTFWTTSPVASTSLLSVLKDEHKHEKEAYVKPEQIANGPPAPFTLSEVPGDTLLTLSRMYQGEEVNVDLHVNNQPSPDYEEGDDSSDEVLNTVVFNVHVTKGHASLVLECESDGTFVAVNHVSHEPADGIKSESVYTGPVFEELDEGLQTQFQEYIAARGITPELGEYLRHLVYDKEQREYTAWLSKVADFVAAKP